jgi:hypothetical protein
MYTIRSAGLKGLGVFANALIPRGTRIFSEQPLLSISPGSDGRSLYASSLLLSPEQRAALMGLSHHASRESSVIRWGQAVKYTLSQTISAVAGRISSPGGGGAVFPKWKLGEHVRLLSIFRSNSFNLSSPTIHQALFPSISRLNHSCVPNSQGNFHEEMGTFNVHATRDIPADEELTLNYLHEHGAVRESRQERLKSGYGFDCDCPACDMSLQSGRHGEEGRVEMQRVLGDYASKMAEGGAEDPQGELTMVNQLITLLEGDGIAGRELSTL